MGMKFQKEPSTSMQDSAGFSVSGVSGGTFPNAEGRGQRTAEYWAAVEKDLNSQRQEAQKQGGKQLKTSSRKQTPVKVTLTR